MTKVRRGRIHLLKATAYRCNHSCHAAVVEPIYGNCNLSVSFLFCNAKRLGSGESTPCT